MPGRDDRRAVGLAPARGPHLARVIQPRTHRAGRTMLCQPLVGLIRRLGRHLSVRLAERHAVTRLDVVTVLAPAVGDERIPERALDAVHLQDVGAQGCRVERDAPWGTPAPSSNRTCSFPAYGSPCGTGFISFAPLRPSAPFHIDSDGCSSIWTSGFRHAATNKFCQACLGVHEFRFIQSDC